MNSASSKIVYECVSQRDLTNLWPEASPNGRSSHITHVTSARHEVNAGIAAESSGSHGFARVTSFVTQVWKNPRYFRWILTLVISFNFATILGFLNSYGSLYMSLRKDLGSSATETGRLIPFVLFLMHYSLHMGH